LKKEAELSLITLSPVHLVFTKPLPFLNFYHGLAISE